VASNSKYGLVEIAGSSVMSITFWPLKSQVKRLMIDRGITLPLESLRWPDSIACEIRVLMVTTSPAEADFGTRTRGLTLSAMSFVLA